MSAWTAVSDRFAYQAGVSGTVNVPAGYRVLTMTAHANADGGTVAIGGGDNIPMNAGAAWGEQLLPAEFGLGPASPTLEGPLAIVFTGTDSYYVSGVRV